MSPSVMIHALSDYMNLLARKFMHDRCLTVSSSLTYTTLLALVPLLSVALAMFSTIPAFATLITSAQTYLFQIFTPNIESTVMQHLFAFVKRARSLNAVGIVALLVTTLITLFTIDTALNHIWRINRRRNTFKSLLTYFSVVVFGPLLLGLSLLLTTYFAALPLVSDTLHESQALQHFFPYLPLLFTIVTFTLVYRWVPNTRVPWWHALLGGMAAALFFELAKRGFILYVTWFPTYELIYGALAIIPLLLIWVYVSWVIVLFGAEVACCLGLFVPRLRGHYSIERFPVLYVYKLVELLWLHRDRGLEFHQILRSEPVAGEWLQGQLAYLERVGLVCMDDEGRWRLRQDPRVYTFYELMAVINRLPANVSMSGDFLAQFDTSISQVLTVYHDETSRVSRQPLATFFASPASAPWSRA